LFSKSYPNSFLVKSAVFNRTFRFDSTFLRRSARDDPTEALRLRWIDITDNVITINQPVKNHDPRQLQVSNKLVAMLLALPKDSELIFPTTYNNMALCFYNVRRKVAQIQQNPRILKISLGTFRHWGATMVYHQTRDILLVKKLLGYKKIENTMKYT
jgi:integrase